MSIPMDQWGKDHYSTLGYLECRCVDHGGIVNRQHLRVDPARHPAFGHTIWRKDYPTRLKNGERSDHDDIDCIEDMVAEGLVEWGGTGFNPVFKITDFGMMVCNALRNHKSAGGSFSTFSYSAPLIEESKS